MENYALNLKEYRLSIGLNQTEMAKKLKVSHQQAYMRYEKELPLKKATQFSQLLKHDLTRTKTDELLEKMDKMEQKFYFIMSKVAKIQSETTKKPYETCMAEIYKDFSNI